MLLALLSQARADNWPRFRGDNGTGIVNDEACPTEFDGKKPLWKIKPPGGGNSSPIIWGGRIFLNTEGENGKERGLACIELATGKLLWQTSEVGATARIHKKNSLASGTPATDGVRVYTPIWDGEKLAIHAFDFAGKEVWTHDVGPFASQHGAGHSPIVHQNKVIFSNDQDGTSSMLALDAESGKVLWDTPRPAKSACYSTPFIYEQPDRPAEVVTASTMGFAGFQLEKGTEVWHWDWNGNSLRTVGSPVFGAGVAVVGSGNGGGNRNTAAVLLGGKGDVTKTSLAWSEKQALPYVPCMLIWGENLFFVNDRGIAGCYIARTGEKVWDNKRLNGSVTASPILVNGKIIAINDNGEVFTIAAEPNYKLLSRTQLDDAVTASPAVSDGHLVIRGHEYLFCFKK